MTAGRSSPFSETKQAAEKRMSKVVLDKQVERHDVSQSGHVSHVFKFREFEFPTLGT